MPNVFSELTGYESKIGISLNAIYTAPKTAATWPGKPGGRVIWQKD